MIALVNGNALKIPLADKSVHMVCCSPPYWGLRDYGLATWEGGDPGCDHVTPLTRKGGISDKQSSHPGSYQIREDTICRQCGAIRHDAGIGLEPTPEEYIANMVAVGREIWRVLRDDGTLWLNLGDSYAGSGEGGGGNRKGNEHGQHDNMIGKRGNSGLKPKDLVGIPWRVAFALQADGWWLRDAIIWAKAWMKTTVLMREMMNSPVEGETMLKKWTIE